MKTHVDIIKESIAKIDEKSMEDRIDKLTKDLKLYFSKAGDPDIKYFTCTMVIELLKQIQAKMLEKMNEIE